MFYALATNQEFIAQRVNLFVALAPVVRFKYAGLSLRWPAVLETAIEYIAEKERIWSVFGLEFNKREKEWEETTILGEIFSAFEECVLDYDSPYNNEKWIIVDSWWSPSRASVK